MSNVFKDPYRPKRHIDLGGVNPTIWLIACDSGHIDKYLQSKLDTLKEMISTGPISSEQYRRLKAHYERLSLQEVYE